MLDELTRSWKEPVLAPFARWLTAVHPHLMTLLSLILGLASAVFAWQQGYGLCALFFALNRFADGLDGTMARLNGQQSDFGGYLDIMVDFLIYALVPLALVLGRPSVAAYLALAVLLAVYYVNAASWMYLAAILEKRVQGAAVRGEMTTVTMPAGLIGGTETVIFYFAFILAPMYLDWLFYISAGLLVITIIQRLVWAAKTL